MNKRRVYRTDFQAVQLQPGNAYVVVDCGGGTVDITVHLVGNEGDIVEIEKASGKEPICRNRAFKLPKLIK